MKTTSYQFVLGLLWTACSVTAQAAPLTLTWEFREISASIDTPFTTSWVDQTQLGVDPTNLATDFVTDNLGTSAQTAMSTLEQVLPDNSATVFIGATAYLSALNNTSSAYSYFQVSFSLPTDYSFELISSVADLPTVDANGDPVSYANFAFIDNNFDGLADAGTTATLYGGFEVSLTDTTGCGQLLQPELAVGLTLTPVPEPETYAMMLAGLGLLGLMVRRRA